MTDVARGGATVFPRLGVRVQPIKGTALVWFNLHSSGEVNQATLHGACPVLLGSKWGEYCLGTRRESKDNIKVM